MQWIFFYGKVHIGKQALCFNGLASEYTYVLILFSINISSKIVFKKTILRTYVKENIS